MAKKSVKKSEQLIDDETLHKLLKPYAYKVFKDLSEQSHYVIDKFYSDYDPAMYRRTFGMKNLFRPSIKRTEKGYRVEFIYSVDYLTTEHRNNEAVFSGSFVDGWHGGKFAWGHLKSNVPRIQPSPWRTLMTYVKAYKI